MLGRFSLSIVSPTLFGVFGLAEHYPTGHAATANVTSVAHAALAERIASAAAVLLKNEDR